MEPRWLKTARRYLGTKEIPGAKHSSVIARWLARLGAWWRDDETPWCGTFVAECLKDAGLPLPRNWYRAKEWANYGSNLRSTHVAPGAILVFARTGGGHVGFYVGEDHSYFYVLGGNQGNAVSVAKIAKVRCIAIRWPKGEPVIGGPKYIAMDAKVTTNEQ